MTITNEYIQNHLDDRVSSTTLVGFDKVHTGKVRDTYEKDGKRIIISTDRHSSFDRALPPILFKGQLLNLTSAFWFKSTEDIIKNHLIDVPDPAVSIVRKADVFPVEMVIRGFMTGSTNTSVWKNYEKGVRKYCGIDLPEGMKKNQPFAKPIITPTTKEESGHDELISAEEILERNLMTEQEWQTVSEATMKIFLRGQKMAAERGLILVDTKFEFGKDSQTGEIIIIDEVLTSDSSRYWLKSTYEERIEAGLEPQSFDKEFLRLWYREHCDPYNDETLPEPPAELLAKMTNIYIDSYKLITGKTYEPATGGQNRIQKNLDEYFAKG